MRRIITGPDGTQHVLTEEQILHLALKQLFPPPKAEPDLPPMVEVGEGSPEPQPEAPYDATATNEPPPHEYAPEPTPAAPDPMEQLAPLIMQAIDRVVEAIEQQGATIGEAIAAQGEQIEAAAAQQAQSVAALAEEMGAEKEVVRDDDGRVKGSRSKPRELN